MATHSAPSSSPCRLRRSLQHGSLTCSRESSNSSQRSRRRPSRSPARARVAAMGSPCRGKAIRCWEDRRVESRSHLAWFLGCTCLAVAAAGCSDAINAGTLQYVEAEALTKDLGAKTNLYGKPTLQNKVRQALVQLFGPNPQEIHLPDGSGLLGDGIYLANYLRDAERPDARHPIYQGTGPSDFNRKRQEGGYAIYRRNCLHCHGV